MAAKSIEDIIRCESRAVAMRTTWEGTWGDCYDYTMPGHNGFSRQTRGDRGDELIFDDTAVVGVQDFSSRMIQGIVPDNARWIRLEPSPTAAGELDEDQLKPFRAILTRLQVIYLKLYIIPISLRKHMKDSLISL